MRSPHTIAAAAMCGAALVLLPAASSSMSQVAGRLWELWKRKALGK